MFAVAPAPSLCWRAGLSVCDISLAAGKNSESRGCNQACFKLVQNVFSLSRFSCTSRKASRLWEPFMETGGVCPLQCFASRWGPWRNSRTFLRTLSFLVFDETFFHMNNLSHIVAKCNLYWIRSRLYRQKLISNLTRTIHNF